MRATPRSVAIKAAIALAATTGLLAVPGAEAAKLGARTLKRGMRGPDVRALQRGLSTLSIRTAADGRYGRATALHVRELERRWRWHPDGRVQRWQGRLIRSRVSDKRARRASVAADARYVFPVPAPHSFGGPANRFGAPRSGHIHQGQDILAACGSAVVAVTSGVIRTRAYQGVGAGYYVVLRGGDGTDTMYAHFRRPSWTSPGLHVSGGQQIGQVGHTGDATGCHLHFEHWSAPGWYAGGAPYDPLPELLTWDAYS